MFRDPRWRPVWLLLRLWLGYQWLEAGLHKVADPRWMVTGEALQSYWLRAAGLVPGANPTIKYAWYESFIRWLAETGQHLWFAKLVAVGELLVGVGLLVGGLTVLAAAFGAFMNLNYMLAGTASTNPVLYTAAILLIAAGPAAYHWGVDRFLLPWLKNRLARALARPRLAERTT